MSTAIGKERSEGLKHTLAQLAEQDPKVAANDEAPSPEPEVEEPPFGGGQLLGLIVNPTSMQVQALQGYDEHGFSNSRSYGCSIYMPLAQYCSILCESKDPVDRMVGRAHLGDRFMVKRPTSPPFSEAEESVYKDARGTGYKLFEQGAAQPLAFPKVKVFGHKGVEYLDGHYVPVSGLGGDVLESFKVLMSRPDDWLRVTRIKMVHLKKQIDEGRAAPVPGYEETLKP